MSLESENPCKVWSKFDGKRKDGSVVQLRIQDLDWDKHEKDAIEFIMKYFIKDDTFFKASGIYKNEDAVTEYKELFAFFCNEQRPHVSVCYRNDDSLTNEIIGISFVTLKKYRSDDELKDDKSASIFNFLFQFKPKTNEVQNLVNIIQVTEDNMKEIKSDKSVYPIYEGRGICVRPDHRGLGIANEFVRLRKQICNENNIKMTRGWMTAIGTQKAADKYNWKTFLEITVEEFERKTGLDFEANVPTFKLMYTTKD